MSLRTLKEGSLARQVDSASTRYHYTTYKVGRTLRCQLMGARHLFFCLTSTLSVTKCIRSANIVISRLCCKVNWHSLKA